MLFFLTQTNPCITMKDLYLWHSLYENAGCLKDSDNKNVKVEQ